MANVTIAQVQCDSTIAIQVVKDFLIRSGVDISTITDAATARAAMETELKKYIKRVVIEKRMDDDASTARATSQSTNNASVVLV